jgi:hypothetical protein
MPIRVVLLCIALLAVHAAVADEKTGLKEGSDLPGPFRPFNVANGRYPGKFHCLVCEHGLNPGVLIFAQDFKVAGKDDALSRLLKDLDDYMTNNRKTRLRVFSIFLYPDLPDVVTEDDARVARAGDLRSLQKDADLRQVVLALDGTSNLQKCGYEIDPRAGVSVVLYDRMKVQKLYSFPPGKLTAEDVKSVLAEVTGKLAPKTK